MNTLVDKLKGSWRSWTIRFNALCIALLALLPSLQDALPLLAQYVPEMKWAFALVILGNVLLRFKTSSPLELK